MKNEIVMLLKEHELLKEERISTSRHLSELERTEQRMQSLLSQSKSEIRRAMQQLIDFDVCRNYSRRWWFSMIVEPHQDN